MTDDPQKQILRFVEQNVCSSTAEIASGLRLEFKVLTAAIRALYSTHQLVPCGEEEGRHQIGKKYFETVPVKRPDR